MNNKLFEPAPKGQVYVCAACGKTSKTKAPTKQSDHWWDKSCMLNCVLCYEEKGSDGLYQAVEGNEND